MSRESYAMGFVKAAAAAGVDPAALAKYAQKGFLGPDGPTKQNARWDDVFSGKIPLTVGKSSPNAPVRRVPGTPLRPNTPKWSGLSRLPGTFAKAQKAVMNQILPGSGSVLYGLANRLGRAIHGQPSPR